MCEGRQQQKLKKKEKKRGEGLSGSFMILFLTCLLFNHQPSLEFYLTFSLRVPRSCRTCVHLLFFCPQKSLMSLAHLKWRERENSEKKREKKAICIFEGYFFLSIPTSFSSCEVCQPCGELEHNSLAGHIVVCLSFPQTSFFFYLFFFERYVLLLSWPFPKFLSFFHFQRK